MYNVLISSRDINFIKKILPNLSHNIENIRVTDISTNEQETISAILSGTIDIILFDNHQTKLNIFNILEKLKSSFIFPFPVLIVLGSSLIELEKCNENTLINKFIYKNSNIEKIVKRFKEITLELQEKHSKKIYEEKAFKELSNLFFNSSHNGTKYLVYSTLILKFCKNDDFTNKFEKNVYAVIAQNFNTSICNVKSNILKAIDYAYRHGSSEKIAKYFHIYDNSKATPKLIVTILARKI